MRARFINSSTNKVLVLKSTATIPGLSSLTIVLLKDQCWTHAFCGHSMTPEVTKELESKAEF